MKYEGCSKIGNAENDKMTLYSLLFVKMII